MYNRLLCAVMILLLGGGTSTAFAQRSGTVGGRFASHTISQDQTEMPDGSMMVTIHYHQTAFADDQSHPLDNISNDCVGMLQVSGEGAAMSASGSCFGIDADGDRVASWWRMDEGGTDDCPVMCGSWGFFAGTGKFEGLEGSGTWEQKTTFANSDTGTWRGSYTMR